MKRLSVFALILCLIPMSMTAKAPKWASKLPKAENATYRYVVESATATTENAAQNKAMGLVLQGAIRSLGLTMTSTQVENAISSGTVESIATEFKIPVNKVCTYTEKLNGGVRVYVLCQVAVKSDRVQAVQFTEFRNCGDKGGSDIEISGRPDNWQRFEAQDYFSVFLESELEKGEDEVAEQKRLTSDSKTNLLTNLNMTSETRDESISALITTEQSYHKQSKTVYAVAYAPRDKVVEMFSDKIDNEIDVCFRKIDDAQSYIKEENMNNARAVLDGMKLKIEKQIEPRLNFLRAYSVSRSVNRSMEDVKELKGKIMELTQQLRGGVTKAKGDKVQEYVKNAERCLKERKLADALRYYYAAQVLLKDMPNASSFVIKTGPNGATENANTHIINSIKEILSNVQITFDGFLPGSETEAKLGFIYKGEAVTNLSYRYNDNNGWSEELPVKDGWTVISLPVYNRPSTINVMLEYRYEADAAFDPELQNLIGKNRFNYDAPAKHTIAVNNAVLQRQNTAGSSATGSQAARTSTSMNQNIVAEKISENRHKVSQADSAKYMNVISKVCKAVNAKNYESISEMFTLNGCKQLDSLLKYGDARVLSTPDCKFVKIGDEVMCRSIPMSFSFSKGKKTFENVVFTFDATGKIDGIQFALEERSARNIMANNKYSEEAKLTLVNFMENYKTAYALKRLGYINSIFADDAVIIVGRVLQHTNNIDIGQKKLNDVQYTKFNKKEYMARLANQFASKEWINIKFSNTSFDKSAQGNMYSIQLLQDYMSDNYGDRGYLFLLIDCTDPDRPLIKVRSWQPESAGATPFSMAEYDAMMEEQ